MNAFEVLWAYRQAFLGGLVGTAGLVSVAVALGTAAGVLLERACALLGRPAQKVIDLIAFPFSVVPGLVVLFWLYYPAQTLLGISVSPFWTASATLIVINGLAVYRILSDATHEFPKQYIAAAQVCGMDPSSILRHIRIPLVVRATLPRWIDQQVAVLQASVFASLISVEELFRAAQRINAQVYQPVVIYTAMALMFLIAAGPPTYLSKRLRERYYRDFSER